MNTNEVIELVPLAEVAPLVGQHPTTARRKVSRIGRLVDERVPGREVSVPVYRGVDRYLFHPDDLKRFDRLVFSPGMAPADAGNTRQLGLVLYMGYEGAWVAVGNVWPLVTLAASEPRVCAVSSVSDGEGGRMAFRAEVDVFNEARFREALKAVFA